MKVNNPFLITVPVWDIASKIPFKVKLTEEYQSFRKVELRDPVFGFECLVAQVSQAEWRPELCPFRPVTSLWTDVSAIAYCRPRISLSSSSLWKKEEMSPGADHFPATEDY